MFAKIVLAIQKWWALRSFPNRKPHTSFVFFDYYVPLGGCHDRVLVYDSVDKSVLSVDKTEPVTGELAPLKVHLRRENKIDLFGWLKEQLQSVDETQLIHKNCKDPAQLRLYAFEVETGWKCSLRVSGIQLCEEFRQFRSAFMELIDRIASAVRTNTDKH